MAEHPEDRQRRLAGERMAATRGAEFAQESADKLAALITTYADRDAHELLDALREDFWSRSWHDRKGYPHD